ncbi:MAG TPA: cytochrome c oxidase subunit II [Gemmatimonadales bacterium]
MTRPGRRRVARLVRSSGRRARGALAAAAMLATACSRQPVRNQSALHPAGPQAERMADLWWIALGISAVVFALVLVALGIAMTASRRRRGRRAEEPDASRRLTRIVGAAVGVTVLVLIGWLATSIAAGRPLTALAESGVPDRGEPLTINLTAQQWWWEVEYAAPEPQQRLLTANEIRIPVGRPIVLRMASRDVIHSFWVPSLHGKRDLIPGYTSTTWFQADSAGVYRGQCAEFCGLQHAKMGLVVVAMPRAEFEEWYRSQLLPAAEPADSIRRHGQKVFLTSSCMLCHSIRGTSAGGRLGPDLTHLGSRGTLAAASIPNTRGHLAGWMVDPQRIKPGVHMPPNNLPPQDLQALIAYLEGLR